MMPALYLTQEAAVDSHWVQQKSIFQDIHIPLQLISSGNIQNNLQLLILVTRNFAIVLDIVIQGVLLAYTTHFMFFLLPFSSVLSTLRQRTLSAQ